MRRRLVAYVVFVLLLSVLTACNLPQVTSTPDGEIDAAASVTAAVMTVVAQASPTPLAPAPTLTPEPAATPTVPVASSTPEPTPSTPTATAVPPTATSLPTATPEAVNPLGTGSPPRVDNNAPGGTSADYAEDEVIVGDDFLFQMRILDTRFGDKDGDGIDFVEFFVRTEDFDEIYSRRENHAGYCIFGGGEPDCNTWPQRNGKFVWGDDGPEVRPGKYFVSILVTPKDQEFEGEVWNWDFDFTVALP